MTMLPAEVSASTAQWLGATLTGLASSAHCFGMCGGLQAALAPGQTAPGLWRLQLGRTVAYAAVGAIAGGLSGALGGALATALGPLGTGLRWFAVALASLALLGLAFRLLGRRDVLRLERLGVAVWRLAEPLGRLVGAWREPWRSFALGGIWAFIPCALVLSMATLAATTASATRGALLMVAFALGTWPALLGAAAFGRGVARLDGKSPIWLRAAVAAGLSLLVVAQWMFVFAPTHHHGTSQPVPGHEHHHPSMP